MIYIELIKSSEKANLIYKVTDNLFSILFKERTLSQKSRANVNLCVKNIKDSVNLPPLLMRQMADTAYTIHEGFAKIPDLDYYCLPFGHF